jgi:hypothetical protein
VCANDDLRAYLSHSQLVAASMFRTAVSDRSLRPPPCNYEGRGWVFNMAELLFGVETEYAVAGTTPRGAMNREDILQAILERARTQLVHVPDMNSSGGAFLGNGSRFYADCGLHPEICTPECTNPWDLVRYIQAGHRILAALAASLESASRSGTELICLRCNVDYGGTNSTWGCHESYMHRGSQDALQPHLVPHLVTRLIYTGAGGFNPLSKGLEFTLSPRMAYFRRVVTESSTGGRGIWHEKSEPLCAGYKRLHILCGESLCSETANFLKAGVTALIVAMADAGLAPGSAVQLADPLAALHRVSADVTCSEPLAMAAGNAMTAIAIQRRYLEQAEANLDASFMPAWAAEVCHSWRSILDRLEHAPASVEKTLDWRIKLALYRNHARSLGIRWDQLPFLNHIIHQVSAVLNAREGNEKRITLERAIGSKRPMLKEVTALEPLFEARGLAWEDLRTLLKSREKFLEIDTRFGQLGPKGIFETLNTAGVLSHHVNGVDNIDSAVTEPPATGRAHIRGQVIQRLAAAAHVQCDWQHMVDYGNGQLLDLSDPFAQEESWRALSGNEVRNVRMGHTLAEVLPFDAGYEYAGESSPYSRREDAANRILSGDYAGAETLIRGLLREQFMMPSTLCHLARVLLMTGREAEAREQVGAAWAMREQASAYVVPRILFFRCLFAMLDAADTAPVTEQIRAALRDSECHLDWTIHPLLDHLQDRLGEDNLLFLRALADALSNRAAISRLEEFAPWRNAAIVHAGAV